MTTSSRQWHGYWLAEEEGAGVACIGGGVDDKGEGHIYVLYALPHQQGKGAGQVLVEALTAYQKEVYGVTEQWVVATKGNAKGISFYHKQDFELRHEVSKWHDDHLVLSCHYHRYI